MSPIRVEPTGWRGKPLCRLDSLLLAGYRGALVAYRPGDPAPVRRFPLPIPRWKAACSRVRLLERLLHSEVRWAVPLKGDDCLFLCSAGIWRLNGSTGAMVREDVSVMGKPLSAAVLPREDGAAPDVLVGDYHSNPEREPVRIYRRDGQTGRWSAVYTFPRGAVRHIHNIVPDRERHRVYILTGDEDAECGIWEAPEDVSSVSPLYTGCQNARACQLLPAEDRLLYLTDAPSEPNHLMSFSDGRSCRLEGIGGSVIYGLRIGDSLLFSTAVEPDAHAPNRLVYRFTNRIGAGIRDAWVRVGCLRPDGTVEYLAKYRHDRLPFRLFQYGSASFCASGPSSAYFAPCCVRRADQRIFSVSFDP